MLKELDDGDWAEAFAYAGETEGEFGGTCGDPSLQPALPEGDFNLAPFTREDVAHIQASEEGENDGDEWLIYGRLNDGRWFSLRAGCDYTGWD